MDAEAMNIVVQLISNVGFPIAMCIFMAWYIYTSQSKLTEAINELKETMVEVKAKLEVLK